MVPVEDERRGAARVKLPQPIPAAVSGIPVRVIELSAIGARIEHEERFPLNAPQFRMMWRGNSITVPVQIARAEIAGKREGRLIYQCGIRFTMVDEAAQTMLAAILQWAEAAAKAVVAVPVVAEAKPQPQPERDPVLAAVAESRSLEDSWVGRKAPAPAPSAPLTPSEDTWTRQVRFLKDDLDEDNLPYAQFRLTETGWEKNYVASPEQPLDGFTLARTDLDFAEIQRSFEFADPETRRMMQIALESKLRHD